MAKNGRVYTWFLQPIGEPSNAMIGGCCESEDFIDGIECADGKKRKLWRCTEEVRDAIVESKKLGLPLSFKIFRREGNGKIEDVTFIFKNKPRK